MAFASFGDARQRPRPRRLRAFSVATLKNCQKSKKNRLNDSSMKSVITII